MNEEQYLLRISQLEKEIEYLHGLLDEAGISYKREAKDIEDLSSDRNLLFDENQGDDGANPYTEWMTEVNAFRRICEINEVPILVECSSTG